MWGRTVSQCGEASADGTPRMERVHCIFETRAHEGKRSGRPRAEEARAPAGDQCGMVHEGKQRQQRHEHEKGLG